MRNVKIELEKVLDYRNLTIHSAQLRMHKHNDGNTTKQCEIFLYTDHTAEELKEFWKTLEAMEYNPGYGDQELFGFVLCDKSTWLSRGEYDGSEWWDVQVRPVMKVRGENNEQ